METETTSNESEKNQKSGQKTMIIILCVLVFVLILGMFFLYFSFRKNFLNTIPSKPTASEKVNPPLEAGKAPEMKIPEDQIMGKIKEIGQDKIKVTLSPIYSPGNEKQETDKDIEKSQVNEIKKLVKNPNFNEEKAKQIQDEMRKKYEQNQNATTEPSEESKKLANDETLRPFVEKIISWEELVVGDQVIYQKEISGGEKKILVVLSEIALPPAPPANSNGNVNVIN